MDNDFGELIEARRKAREEKNYAASDQIRITLEGMGLKLHDHPDGSTTIVHSIPVVVDEAAALPDPADNGSQKLSWRQQRYKRLRLRSKAMRPRCINFAAWIVETFGVERLRGASVRADLRRKRLTVMDVAGGHGDLAWALCVTHGVPTTTVDPMPLRLSPAKTKWLLHKANQAAAAAPSAAAERSAGAKASELPAQRSAAESPTGHTPGAWEASARALALAVGDYRAAWLDGPTLDAAFLTGSAPAKAVLTRLRLRHGLDVGSTGGDGGGKNANEGHDAAEQLACVAKLKAVLKLLDHASDAVETIDGNGEQLASKNDDGLGLEQHRELFGVAEVEGTGGEDDGACDIAGGIRPPLEETWGRTTVVVGMHTDMATEALVELALKHRKPFAVVPCCVFADQNPHRRLPSGDGTTTKPVRTLSEFRQWLVAKGCAGGIDGGCSRSIIQTTVLPGTPGPANVVLYVVSYDDAAGEGACEGFPRPFSQLYVACLEPLLPEGASGGCGARAVPVLRYSTDPLLDSESAALAAVEDDRDVTGTVVWDGLRATWSLLAAAHLGPAHDGALEEYANGTQAYRLAYPSALKRPLKGPLGQLRGVVRGKRVLELGAGSGLLGIGCATALLGAAEVVISDLACHLPRIRANIVLNAAALAPGPASPRAPERPGDGWASSAPAATASSSPSPQTPEEGNPCVVSAAVLPWTHDTKAISDAIAAAAQPSGGGCASPLHLFDVVVACEVLHWPALDLWQEDTVPLLAATVRATVRPGGLFLIGYRQRDPDRETRFFDMLCVPDGASAVAVASEAPAGAAGATRNAARGSGGSSIVDPEFTCVLEARPPLPPGSSETQAGPVFVRLLKRRAVA